MDGMGWLSSIIGVLRALSVLIKDTGPIPFHINISVKCVRQEILMGSNKKYLLFVRPLGADEVVAAAANNWSTGNQPQHKLFSRRSVNCICINCIINLPKVQDTFCIIRTIFLFINVNSM